MPNHIAMLIGGMPKVGEEKDQMTFDSMVGIIAANNGAIERSMHKLGMVVFAASEDAIEKIQERLKDAAYVVPEEGFQVPQAEEEIA